MDSSSAPVDGIQPVAPSVPVLDSADSQQIKRWKVLILGMIGASYIIFVLWCGLLLLLLPSTSSGAPLLTSIGLITSLVGAGVIIALSVVSLFHISRTVTTPKASKYALIKIGIIAVPGLLLSAITPFVIVQEASLFIDIMYPTTVEEIVAPVTMTFSTDTAARYLSGRGFVPLRYRWDINGDNKTDSETFDPIITANYDRAGVFAVSVTMVAENGVTRVARRRVVISQAVFSVTPVTPIVDTPVVFDLSNLTTKDVQILNADWDFDGDGNIDESIAGPQASTTYYKTGKMNVSVQVSFTNNTKVSYRRVIDVQNSPPLPFPVQIDSDPKNLVSTAPFTALFSITTDEQVANVQWQFGDGGKGEGMRIAHTFTRNGSYPVQAKIRTLSGTIAEIATSVSIVQRLDLPDLRFDGSPEVSNGKIQGEVPLTVSLKPVTSQPFVTFVWEAPGSTDIGMTEGSLQAIYRREGKYTITLVGTDAENKVLRMPIAVTVQPPSSILSFQMDAESGVAPLTVRFDASESTVPGDDITGFIWGYGDGSPKEYGGASTEHTYVAAGSYVIDLTVRTAGGKQLSTTRTLVVRAPVLQACILPSRMSGPAPFGVEFSSSCTAGSIKQVLWDFGDGAQSDQRDLAHVFMNPGTYTVRLTVTDSTGASHFTTVSVTAQ